MPLPSLNYTDIVGLATSRLIGRTTAGTGAQEALTVGAALSLSAGSLTIAAGGVTNAMLAGSIAASKLVGSDITTIGTLSAGSIPYSLITGGPSAVSGANPSATIGLAAVNGSAATFLRSDGAPTLDQTAAWVFSGLGTTTIAKNGIAATSTDGVVKSNSTASTVSVQSQWSPRDRLSGRAWNTSGSPADNQVDFIQELRPVAGASPSGNLVIASRVSVAGSGAFTDLLTLSSAAILSLGTSTVAGLISICDGSNANDLLSIGGGINASINYKSNALGQHFALIGDSTGSGGPAIFRLGAQGQIEWRSTNRSDAGSTDLNVSRLGAASIAIGNGTNGDFSGGLKLTTLTLLAGSIVTDTTTGLKIGTVGGASGQKLAFWNSTPIVQPLLATGAAHTADDIITTLQNLGLVRQS